MAKRSWWSRWLDLFTGRASPGVSAHPSRSGRARARSPRSGRRQGWRGIPREDTLTQRLDSAVRGSKERELLRGAEESLRRGRRDEAIRAYRAALKIFLGRGAIHKAVAVSTTLTRLLPDDPSVLEELAQIQEQLGHRPEAEAARSRAAALYEARGSAERAARARSSPRAESHAMPQGRSLHIDARPAPVVADEALETTSDSARQKEERPPEAAREGPELEDDEALEAISAQAEEVELSRELFVPSREALGLEPLVSDERDARAIEDAEAGEATIADASLADQVRERLERYRAPPKLPTRAGPRGLSIPNSATILDPRGAGALEGSEHDPRQPISAQPVRAGRDEPPNG